MASHFIFFGKVLNNLSFKKMREKIPNHSILHKYAFGVIHILYINVKS